MSLIIYIISILTIFISLWAYDYYYTKMTYNSLKITTEKNLVFMLTAILAIILESKFDFIVKQIVTIIMYFIPLLLIKIPIKDKIYYAVTNFFTWMLIDFIITNISTIVLDVINSNIYLSINLSESIIYYVILTYIVLITYIIIFNIKKYVTIINRIKIYINNNYVIVSNIIIWLIMVYILVSYDLFYQVDNFVRILLVISLSIISYIMIQLIIYYSRYKDYKEYIENLINNIEGNKENINKYKIEKHNFNNFLLSLKDDNNKLLNEKIDIYLESNNKIKQSNINNIFDIPYNIAGFITNKLSQYRCRYIINGAENLKDISIDNPRLYNEVCNAIGITIDNAYDAIKNQRSKEIIIQIEKNNDKINIMVCNLFKNSIDINELGNLFYTTKSNGNGIGLFSINKSKYVKYNISIINNMFIINLII